MSCINAHHCMAASGEFCDVYRCLIEILIDCVSQAGIGKRKADFITKQPAVAATLGKALQGFTAVAEEEMADKHKWQTDMTERAKLSKKYSRSRAACIRGMAFKQEHASGLPDPVSDEKYTTTQLANFIMMSCATLSSSNGALGFLLQRLRVQEMALRCGRQQ